MNIVELGPLLKQSWPGFIIKYFKQQTVSYLSDIFFLPCEIMAYLTVLSF